MLLYVVNGIKSSEHKFWICKICVWSIVVGFVSGLRLLYIP